VPTSHAECGSGPDWPDLAGAVAGVGGDPVERLVE
jgi:hypothetical protein